MPWMEKVKRLDFPKVGKFIIVMMCFLEAAVYVHLIVINQHSSTAVALSSFLLVSSAIGLVASALSIPLRFYYNHWIVYNCLAGTSIASRAVALAWIIILNLEVSDQFFITQDGYAVLLRTSLIFLILQSVLIFEKCKFYRTRKQAEELLLDKMTRV